MKIIRIRPDNWKLPPFRPGQFVVLGLPAEVSRCQEATVEHTKPPLDKLIKRAYSIASSSTEDIVEFYVTLVHSGQLSPRIFNLEIGDQIWMSKKAVGMFTLDEIDENKNIILMATGTGVAPYMSMLRTDALKRKGNMIVIHGATNSWDLGYSSELKLLANVFPKFSYYPTITNPKDEPPGWAGDIRFFEDIWKSEKIEQILGFKPHPDNTHIFLCGNPIMIKNMKELLSEDSFKIHKKKEPGQIHAEEF